MTEWYRNTDWNEEIEAMFFAKLEKARSQRDQYIVLQAHHISQSHPKVALRLIDLYFDTRTDDFDDGRAHRVAAAAQFASGGYVQALDNYLKLLKGQEANEDIYVGSPLEFAFLTARFRSDGHYDAALEQLAGLEQPSEKEPEPRFRYCAASALITSETGRDPANALAMARSALDMPQEVLDVYSDVAWRLRGITRS
ncbi:hypothetical protein [Aurantiacibacter marinus]|uniref:Uncharacterized protein n=1 Tax=Aurantiacibacter marinus TaxID=874156 RepID=A0A0H0XSG5_9SPHN|nr:hypothetical protein [Aurantiacibacter marinus]KLI64926.1 hypothetical protein AAV99_05375 [Aurantiacibacter marinus]